MAPQTAVSGVLAQLGQEARNAVLQHANDETDFGQDGGLPTGIENGIAKLVACEFGLIKEGDNKGKPYFRAAGVIVSPETHAGVKVAGRQTSIYENVFDTPNSKGKRKSVADHIGHVMNEMRKLGAPTKGLQDTSQLEATAKALVQAAPHFKFRTWQGKPTTDYPNPRVNEQWGGQVAAPDAVDATVAQAAAVEDNTGSVQEAPAAPQTLGARADDGDNDAAKQLNERAQAANVDPEDYPTWVAVEEALDTLEANAVPDTEPTADEEAVSDDLTALGEAADLGDGDAAERLTELAGEAGLDPDEYETWEELAAALEAGPSEPEEEAAAEEPVEEVEPEKGQLAIHEDEEYEVTAVFKTKKVANIKNIATGVIKKQVPWSELEG